LPFSKLLLANCAAIKNLPHSHQSFSFRLEVAGGADAAVGHDGMPSVAPASLNKEAFTGVNSAGNRDASQS
jgi:hypothetical protein